MLLRNELSLICIFREESEGIPHQFFYLNVVVEKQALSTLLLSLEWFHKRMGSRGWNAF